MKHLASSTLAIIVKEKYAIRRGRARGSRFKDVRCQRFRLLTSGKEQPLIMCGIAGQSVDVRLQRASAVSLRQLAAPSDGIYYYAYYSMRRT